jgi:hypothetical protein
MDVPAPPRPHQEVVMARVWYCTHCGYEVNRGGKCHNCKEPLTASSLAELAEGETDDELGYRLNDWEDEDRGQLIEALVEAGLRHRFESDELVVSAQDEVQVDRLMSDVSGRSGVTQPEGETGEVEPVSDMPPDPAMVAAVTALYDAARRLRRDPTDMVADTDVAEASADMFSLNHVYGIDADSWAAIGRVTRRLLGALGADVALEDDIADQAAILCRLLDPLVEAKAGMDAEPTDAEPTDAVPTDADADAHDEDEDEELVYELDDWLPEERAQLDLLLERDEVPRRWEGPDLVVPAAAEASLGPIFDEVDHASSLELPAAEGDDEAEYMALSDLFGASDRLAGDPDNKNRRAQFHDAAEAISEWSTPFGMTDDQWWRIRGQAKAVRDAIDADIVAPLLTDSATALRELLRQFV